MRRCLVLLLLAVPLIAQAQDPAEEKRARLAFFTSSLEPAVVIDKNGSAGAALGVYEAWARGKSADTPVPRETMAAIYRAAGDGPKAFKTVAHLIKTRAIPETHSISMARVREAEIVKLVNTIAKENGWKIARSDSGNVTSGMKSDLDQTFYVFEPSLDENGKPILQADGTPVFERKAELDGKFIAEFEGRWDAELGPLGLSRQALDVASIEGRNRFPDPRQDVQIGFWTENRRATEALRNTPGAYTYAGAVAHQMQFRAMQSIIEGNERAYQIFAPDAEGEWAYRGTDVDEAVETMFGRKPDLRPSFAFDAALANFLELQHYMHAEKFETKYHLRTWEDSLYSLMLVEQGKGRESKVDLTKLDEARRKSLVFASMNKLFPDDPIKRRRHALAMEISTRQRLVHKDELAIADRDLFAEFGKAVFGKDWTADEAGIADARREYRRVSSEFCLEASYLASGEALALLVGDDPKNQLKLEAYREILGFKDVPDAEWQATVTRLKEATHLTFLFGIYDLGLERSTELMTRLANDHGLRIAPYLFGMWLRGSVQGIESHLREPGRYSRLYADKLAVAGDALALRTKDYVLGELGYRHESVIDRATGELTGRQLIWDPKVVAKNMAYDPGNIDALAQVIKAYILSEGDWEVALATLADEFLLAIPVVGQVVGASRGGVGGLVIMGAAMANPTVGGILIAVSLAEAGYAIYDVEYARPVAGQVENAIYRGYIGPELRYYDKPPPAFTKEEKKELDALRARLGANRPSMTFTPPYTYDLQTLRAARAAHEKKLRDWAALQQEIGPKIAALEAKQAASELYLRDPAAGGGYFGFGAQLRQRAFGPSLLAAIEPIISFSPYGFIDFRARQDADELARLEARKDEKRPVPEKTALDVKLRRARILRDRQLRAERYLQQATGRTAVDAADRRDEPQTSLELRHKIRRDSVYPALLELGIEDPDVYVDRWFAANADVTGRLVGEGLLFNDIGEEWVEGPSGAPIVSYTRRSPLDEESKKKIRERFRGDFIRSKALWEAFQGIEKNRVLKDEQDLAQRDAGLEGVAASLAVDELYRDPTLARLYQAMRGEGEPDPGVPVFEATVYRTESGVDCGFTLRCDALEYPPPYELDMRTIGLKEAWKAAQSGRVGPISLTPSACRSIKETLKQEPEEEVDEISVMVITCFDALGDIAGQALALDYYEGEPDVGYIITGPADSDADGLDRILKKRFPEFSGRFDTRLTGTPLRQRATRFNPRVVEVDYREMKELITYAESTNPLDVSDAIRPYKGGFRGTVSCNGHTEHVMTAVGGDGRARSLASPWIYGLKEGDNDIRVDLRLPDGSALSRTFTIGVKLKPRDPEIARRAQGFIEEARVKYAEKGDYYSLKSLHDALGGYVHTFINDGGMPSRVGGLISEMASLHSDLIRLHAQPRKIGMDKPIAAKTAFAFVKHVSFRCTTWGTMDAYSTLSKALENVRGLPDVDDAVNEHAAMENTLGDVLLRAGGSAAAARNHFERAERLRPRGRSNAEIKNMLDEKFPTGSFWN